MKHLIMLLGTLMAAPLQAQDWALERLEKSPRHQEWVQIQRDGRTIHAFQVFPQVSRKVTAVIVIHENQGLTDWVRSVADQLAAAGYIAIAPDLLSGMGPGGGKTSDFSGGDSAREAIYSLSPDQVTQDLNAVSRYVSELPAANGKVVVSGFCWGGSQSFRYATHNPDIRAAFVFYGTGPSEAEDIARISSPVFGFYGGNDARVNASIPRSTDLMRQADKKYEAVTYEGAGHGFMRSGEQPGAEEANRMAREQAWKRWLAELQKI